jgi:tRNA(adenine34) deaminase
MDDKHYMGIALEQAKESALRGEVPVGAVVVDERSNVIAAAGNAIICDNDPVGHAEILALRSAAKKMSNYRLPGTTMFVTLEPCAMCAAAMVHARVARLVFGATDPKTGAVVSKYNIGKDGRLNHSFSVTGGVLAKECGQLLKDFFQMRR